MEHPISPSGTLLFQGDSITDAFRRPEEINEAFRLGNGYAFIAGSCLRATAGLAGLSVQNRGVSGHTARDLLQRWQRDCIELRPEVLSLLIGINDCLRVPPGGDAMQGFAQAYDELLRQVRDALPPCRLVLIEPFFLPVVGTDPTIADRLAPIQAHVRAAAARLGATFVPLQQEFTAIAGDHPERWIYDGLHPTSAGHWLIARRWLELVAGIVLPAPRPFG